MYEQKNNSSSYIFSWPRFRVNNIELNIINLKKTEGVLYIKKYAKHRQARKVIFHKNQMRFDEQQELLLIDSEHA